MKLGVFLCVDQPVGISCADTFSGRSVLKATANKLGYCFTWSTVIHCNAKYLYQVSSSGPVFSTESRAGNDRLASMAVKIAK